MNEDLIYVNFNRIMRMVAAEFGISYRELSSPTRRQAVADARGMCMYIFKRANVISDEMIGQIFNRRRTTVVHAHRNMAEQLEFNPSMRRHYENIVNRISGKC